MKRFFALALFIVFAISAYSTAFAETSDLGSMDYDSLLALKQAVDAELFSRPEAEPLILAPGNYTVGPDIKAGRYYVIMNAPGDSAYVRLHVYASREIYDQRPSGNYGEYLSDDYIGLGDEPISVSLVEGNFLYVQNASLAFSVSAFTEDDFYVYTPPEGTYVPAGAYLVGENGDIPVGNYTAYAGTLAGGDIKLYYKESTFNEDGSWHLGYDQHIEISIVSGDNSETLKLQEGNLVYVEHDVVMKKQAKLNFD